MERLDFELPEFTRVSWVSEKAREFWESKFSAISRAWIEIERLAVIMGAKPAALQTCAPDQLPELSDWAIKKGLACLPLQRQGESNTYSNATRPCEEGKPWTYRVLIAPRSIAMYFSEYWQRGDNEKIGVALGFPDCCREFFNRYWTELGWRDLVVPMSLLHLEKGLRYQVSSYAETNILLHRLGLRLVSHLPCGFDCLSSKNLGERFKEIGRQYGYTREMDTLVDILSWPVQYTTLHGVSITTTPVIKIVANSTALAGKVVIDKLGDVYPEHGASGTVFPFQISHPLVLHRTDRWTDNGFRSQSGMDAHHEVLLNHVRASLSELGEEFPQVLDLGCGNGLLLEKIGKAVPDARLYGIEINSTVFDRAAQRLPLRNSILKCASIFDFDSWNDKHTLILVAEQRFREALQLGIPDFPRVLLRRGKRVLVYNYEDDSVRAL